MNDIQTMPLIHLHQLIQLAALNSNWQHASWYLSYYLSRRKAGELEPFESADEMADHTLHQGLHSAALWRNLALNLCRHLKFGDGNVDELLYKAEILDKYTEAYYPDISYKNYVQSKNMKITDRLQTEIDQHLNDTEKPCYQIKVKLVQLDNERARAIGIDPDNIAKRVTAFMHQMDSVVNEVVYGFAYLDKIVELSKSNDVVLIDLNV